MILCGYYICKTVREPLILADGGAEVKAYASGLQALVLMAAVPAYSCVAARVSRRTLVLGLTLFFVANLEMFWLLGTAGVPYLGVAFFVWVGVFNNAVVAQFWSYANDLYTPERGRRLFPVIAIGATLGSPVGAWVAGQSVRCRRAGAARCCISPPCACWSRSPATCVWRAGRQRSTRPSTARQRGEFARTASRCWPATRTSG